MRLCRPADGILPIAWLAGCCIGKADAVWEMLLAWLAVRLLGLFSADGVRAAYATQPGMQEVRGSTTLALLLQVVGALIAIGLYLLIGENWDPPQMLMPGLMLNIEHVFYEYIHADGDRHSAGLCRLITGAAVLLALYFSDPLWQRAALFAATMASVLIATIGSGYRFVRPNIQPLRCAPRAMLYGLLYPVAALAAGWLLMAAGLAPAGMLPAFLTGLILFSLCRTPFRRSGMEARPLNRALGLTALIAAISGLLTLTPAFSADLAWIGPLARDVVQECCAMVIVAALCAFLLWSPLRRTERSFGRS